MVVLNYAKWWTKCKSIQRYDSRLSTLVFGVLTYLSKCYNQRKYKRKKTWLEQPRLCAVWVHRTVRWCTGQCPVCQDQSRRTACSRVSTVAYDYKSPDCPVVHQTVSGESAAAKSPLSGTKSTAYDYNSPDCPVRHRTVR